MAVAPWILLPLLAVAPGRERAAALRSGVAVLALPASDVYMMARGDLCDRRRGVWLSRRRSG